MRRALLSASLAVVAASAFIVPLPWVELTPGPAVDVPPRIRMGHPTHPVNGRLLLLTVDLSQPSAAGALQALAGSHRELVPISEVIPPGTDPGRYERAERAVFADSAKAAAAVALRATGFPVAVAGAPGDVAALARRGASGGLLRALAPRITLPFPVTIAGGEIGGPSAGLMMALSVYDLVGPVDLVRGRTIAGTGTTDLAGGVGPIGGIAEKVVGAEKAGSTVFLAPASQVAAARAAASPKLQVIPVRTFEDAVAALLAPHPPATAPFAAGGRP
jgi:PDZ domain-containing protein